MAEQSVDDIASRAPDVESPTIGVTIRYFAAARAAAGVQEERLLVPTVGPAGARPTGVGPIGVGPTGVRPTAVRPTGVDPTDSRAQDGADPMPVVDRGMPGAESTVGQLLDIAAARHGSGLVRVLARCSFLLDEVAVHGRQTPVRDGQVLDILPPFAGG